MSAKAFELKTRKPTCAVPWPQILIEGMEKSGKTWLCAEFSGSNRVSRTFWLEIGPAAGTADQYGAVPGARYEIVEHDGSWEQVYGAVLKIHQAAGEALARGEKPAALVVDVTGAIWDLLKDQVSARAAVSKTNRKRVAEDPAAELVIPRNLWNDATKRHNQIVTLFLTFPGIVLLTANGKEVSATGPDGQPLENKKDWRVDTQKELPAYVTCWVRMFREERARIIGARSVHAGVRPGHDEPRILGKTWNLEWLIFDMLALDPATAYVREFTELQTGVMSPQQIRDEACNPDTTFERIRQLYAIARDAGFDDVILQNETGDDENLLALLARVGSERRSGPAGGRPGQRGHVSRIAPAQPAGGEWLAATLRLIPEIGLEACRTLWREVAGKRRTGEMPEPDIAQVLDLLKARMEALAGPPQETAEPPCSADATVPAAAGLDPDDPWAIAVKDLIDAGEAERLLADVRDQAGHGKLGPDRAALIEQAVEEAFPGITRPAESQAA